MKRFFYSGILLVVLFEIARVYFIMPLPGSQEGEFVGLAYFLHTWRWAFRIAGLATIGLGASAAFQGKKWIAVAFLGFGAGIAYLMNFVMAADGMFLQPNTLRMVGKSENTIALDKLVMGVSIGNEAKAYPIQLIAYHHQVIDTIGGTPLMITYCSVCRTGRVFKPIVNGKHSTFRLVGMDHYNAMFEDSETGSWWRQGTGEAVAGTLKGQMLPELSADHATLQTWLELHPHSTIMQPDPNFLEEYAALAQYDQGQGTSNLTKSDTAIWSEKSWVVGMVIGKQAKAFSWSRLQSERIIESTVGTQAILLVLASDKQTFFAFERPDSLRGFSLQADTLQVAGHQFNLEGHHLAHGTDLQKVRASQEFWHSWRTFHPNTTRE